MNKFNVINDIISNATVNGPDFTCNSCTHGLVTFSVDSTGTKATVACIKCGSREEVILRKARDNSRWRVESVH